MTTKITTEVIDSGAITNDKITSLATSKLTGTISNTQLAGGITNDKITSLAASKLTGALPAIDGSNLTGVEPPTTLNAVGTYRMITSSGTNNNVNSPYGAIGSIAVNPGSLTGSWRVMDFITTSSVPGNILTTYYFVTLLLRVS